MVSARLVEDLSAAPPQEWAQIVRRNEVLERFSEGDGGAAVVTEAAIQLNVSLRYFYKLLKSHRERAVGAPPRSSKTGFAYGIDPVQDRIIFEAIAAIGPGGRFAQVYREVAARSERERVDVPTKTSVRTRFGKARLAIDLPERLGTHCPVLVDLCGLELELMAPDGSISPATLLVVVETETSRISHHKIFTGRPNTQQVARQLEIGLKAHRFAGGRPVEVTSELQTVLTPLTTRCVKGNQFCLSTQSRALRSGAVVRAIFGRKLGRVLTRADPKTWMNRTSFDPVSSLVVEAVFGAQIEERNLKLPIANRRGGPV